MNFELVENKDFADLQQFQQWVSGLKKFVAAGTIFLLKGDLGAGKTELVKTLLSELGSKEVVSPTFALQQSYHPSHIHFKGLVVDHWDLYRLESEDELESTGFWDQFITPDFCVWIEWPERLSSYSLLPRRAKIFLVEIEIVGTGRRVRISKKI